MVGVDRLCMAYNRLSIKLYMKGHLELQREITLIELAPSPYFFVLSICLVYMNMFAMFDENPAMTLQDIKETKRYRRTDARTHGRTQGQRENSIPTTNKVCGGYNYIFFNFNTYSRISLCARGHIFMYVKGIHQGHGIAFLDFSKGEFQICPRMDLDNILYVEYLHYNNYENEIILFPKGF